MSLKSPNTRFGLANFLIWYVDPARCLPTTRNVDSVVAVAPQRILPTHLHPSRLLMMDLLSPLAVGVPDLLVADLPYGLHLAGALKLDL